MSDRVRPRGAISRCLALLCGAVMLAGCHRDDRSITSDLTRCESLLLQDYLVPWRLTLPSTLTGSSLARCDDAAFDGAPIVAATETPCPADPISPCPVALSFSLTVHLLEYHPGGVPQYGFTGMTAGGLTIFGRIDDTTCTASFSFTPHEDLDLGCSGTVVESLHEIVASCPAARVLIPEETREVRCEVHPPLEPLISYQPP